MATRTRKPTIPITEIEHAAFCKTQDELPAKSLGEELAVNVRWQQIPDSYLRLTAEELDEGIHQVREKLGKSVTILFQLQVGDDEARLLMRELQAQLGCGATYKGGAIELQGDHRSNVESFFETRGLKLVRAGG